jgi:hypothetical protein
MFACVTLVTFGGMVLTKQSVSAESIQVSDTENVTDFNSKLLQPELSFLATGSMAVTGNANENGVYVTEDGNYIGVLELNYETDSLFDTSIGERQFVLSIPVEMRDLAKTTDFKNYITADFETSGIGLGTKGAFTAEQIEISSDGSAITFTLPDDFEFEFLETTTIHVEFYLAGAIEKSNVHITPANDGVHYEFRGALVRGFNPATLNFDFASDDAATAYTKTNVLDNTKSDISVPLLNNVVEGQTTVTGTGTAGDTIEIRDEQGNPINVETVVVDADGTFKAVIPSQVAGTKIQAVALNNGDESNPYEVVVQPKEIEIELSKPTIEAPVEGASLITGTGTPDSTITVTNGNGEKVATGTVQSDGTYGIPVMLPLTAGENLTAVATLEGKTSAGVATTVQKSELPLELAKPTIGELAVGQDSVQGTATPGAVVTLTVNGKNTQTVIAGEDGHYIISVVPPLAAGDVVQAQATLDNQSEESEIKTVPAEVAALGETTLNAVSVGQDVVRGTGTPKAAIVILVNGNEAGSSTVDDEGLFAAIVPNLEIGDVVQAQATLGSEKNESQTQTVPAPLAPTTLEEAEVGQTIVGGDAAAGASVTVTVNGKVIDTVTATPENRYSVLLLEPLRAGDVIQAQTTLGDQTNDSNVVTVPTPELVKPTLDALEVGQENVTGVTSPHANVSVLVNNSEVGTGGADDTGKYTVTIPPLKDGDVVKVQAELGTQHAESEEVKVVGAVFATVEINRVSTEGFVTGSGTPGATLSISVNGVVQTSAEINPEGEFSVELGELVVGDLIQITPSFNGIEGEIAVAKVQQ